MLITVTVLHSNIIKYTAVAEQWPKTQVKKQCTYSLNNYFQGIHILMNWYLLKKYFVPRL